MGLKPLSISNSNKDTKRAKFVSTGAKLASAHPGTDTPMSGGEAGGGVKEAEVGMRKCCHG